MRKVCYLLFSFGIFFLSFISVQASVNTYTRTDSDYLVPDYIDVTGSNRDNVLSTPAVDATEKVYDFADLLTDSEEKKIYQQATKFIKKTDLDLAIVTVSDYTKTDCNGDCTRTYADDFYDYNEFGIGSRHSGVLFLVDMKTRTIYMTTTGDAMDMYSDYRIEQIMDAIYQDFSNQNYYTGITKFMTILENYDTIGVANSKDSHYEISDDGRIVRDIPWLILIGGPLLITGIVMAIMISRNKLVRVATSSREYLDKKTLQTNIVKDRFVHTHTSKTPIYHSSGSSGGGGHSGSSGVSHGGGGHRF